MEKVAKKSSIIKNTVYSFVFQLTSLILSLITAPFLSRVLGAAQLGRVNFISGFANWFTLFSIFGITVYGVRAVAKARHDKERLSKAFSELMIIRFFATLVSLAAYLVVMFTVSRISVEFNLALLQVIVLIGNILNLDWLFQGLEDYRFIAIRSMISRISGVVAILIFVKSQDHVLIYAIILVASTVLPNFFNIFYIKKTVKFSFQQLNISQHIKPLVFFLATSFFINVYVMIDQTLLGFMITDKTASDKQIGLLARVRMFLLIMMTVPNSINNAAMPRLLVKYNNDKEGYKQLLSFSANVTMFLGVALSIGLFFTAKYLLILIGSSEFLEAELALQIFAISILTVSLGNFNYSGRIVALNKEQAGIYITIVTACINLGLNIALIGPLGIVGCAISYVAAEYIGNAIWFFYANKHDRFKIFFKPVNLKYLIAGAGMTGVLFLIQWLLPAITWWMLLINFIAGAATYCLIALVLKEDTVLFGIKKLKTILSRRKKTKPPAFIKTELDGVLIVEPNTLDGNQSWQQIEMHVKSVFAENGLDYNFTEENQSVIAQKDTICALYLQNAPHAQTKLIFCNRGAIWGVAVDLRADSPAYKQWVGVELSAENHKTLIIPKGFAHGFITLCDDAEVVYKVDDPYRKESEVGIIYNDPDIGIDWNVQNPVLSDKDKIAKLLKDCEIIF